MANLNITNRDTSGLVIADPLYRDATATAAATGTWPVGSVLGIITATGKYARFATGASDGTEVPKAVLAEELVITATGDQLIRPLISGRVRQGKLVDAAGAAITEAAVLQLRDYTIIAQPTKQLAIQDNQ